MSFHEMMAIGILLGFGLAGVGGTIRFLTGYLEGGGSSYSRLLPHKWAERGVAIAKSGFLLAIICSVVFFVVD